MDRKNLMNDSQKYENKSASILWRGIQLPGHEVCRILFQADQWHLVGTALFVQQMKPCHLNYQIHCDASWHTLSANIEGWVGDQNINIGIRKDGMRNWLFNESEILGVRGCIDLDLNFSPSTNTIAIRRLNLSIGERRELTAAWLKLPSFTLEPLPQSYQRLRADLYRYESNEGRFMADLVVNQAGLVTEYPGIWEEEATDF